MHQLLIDVPIGKQVDHKESDKTLDNRKSNLRVCTISQNCYNKGVYRNKQSCKYKGVRKETHSRRFYASITADKITTALGHFDAPLEAAKAYDEAAIRLHGEFARTNRQMFPEDFT